MKCKHTSHETGCRRSSGHPPPFVQHVKIPSTLPGPLLPIDTNTAQGDKVADLANFLSG
jgi:hypothetical protein